MEADMIAPARTGGVSRAAAAIVTALGGLTMVVGPFLPFVVADIPQGRESYAGISREIGADGWYFIGVGAALLVFAAVVAATRTVGVWRLFGALGALGAGLVLAVAIIDIVDIATLEEEIPPEAASLVSFSVGIGLYVAAAGAVVGLIGSVMTLLARGEEVAPAPPPPPPPEPPAPAA